MTEKLNAEIENDKYYILDAKKYYWSIDLQRMVKFDDGRALAVKVTNRAFDETLFFGNLINTGISDYETNNSIEFHAQDVIGKYKFKDKVPIFYLEFNFLK